MSYRDLLTELAGTTEEKAAEVFARYEAGDLTAAECEALIATIVGKANIRAGSLAVSSLAATLTLELGEPVPVQVSNVDVQADGHLATAVGTIIGGELDPEMRIRRLGNSEPIAAAARAYSEGITKSEEVTGWSRSLSPGACELCQHWRENGKVFPSTADMAHHPGCTCTQKPVVNRKKKRKIDVG